MRIQLMLNGETVVDSDVDRIVNKDRALTRENYDRMRHLSKFTDPVNDLVKSASRMTLLAIERDDAAALRCAIVDLIASAFAADASICGPDATPGETAEAYTDLAFELARRLDALKHSITVHEAAASPPPADKTITQPVKVTTVGEMIESVVYGPPVTPITQPTPELMPAATPAAKPVADLTDAELRTWIGRRVTDSHAVDLWFRIRDYTSKNGALVGMAMRVSRELGAPSYQAVHRLISMLDKHNLVEFSRKPTSAGTEWTITGVRYPTWLQ